jgi:hypothetical protein
MKATDIMAGDWVMSRRYSSPSRVYATHLYMLYMPEAQHSITIINETKDGSVIAGHFAEELTPIPLTQDILDKNGFKRIQDTYLFNIGTNQFGNDLWIEIGPDSWIENNKVYIDSLKEVDNAMICVTTCKYIHEFQHLLKLCKIEKEIVL